MSGMIQGTVLIENITGYEYSPLEYECIDEVDEYFGELISCFDGDMYDQLCKDKLFNTPLVFDCVVHSWADWSSGCLEGDSELHSMRLNKRKTIWYKILDILEIIKRKEK